jgi:hypothetical protein
MRKFFSPINLKDCFKQLRTNTQAYLKKKLFVTDDPDRVFCPCSSLFLINLKDCIETAKDKHFSLFEEKNVTEELDK